MFYVIALDRDEREPDVCESEADAIASVLVVDDQDTPYAIYNDEGEYVCLVFMNQVWRRVAP